MLIDPRHPGTSRELRWFAGLWFPALCGVAGWWAVGDATRLAVVLWGTGAALGIAGLARPKLIRPAYVTLMRVTYPIGWLLSHALLFVMYFAVVTPVGVLVRLFTDPLDRAFDPEAQSYWVEREPSRPERYFRQF